MKFSGPKCCNIPEVANRKNLKMKQWIIEKECTLPEQALDAVSVASHGVLPSQVLELRVHLLVEILPQEK
jgi:hypothetical protein